MEHGVAVRENGQRRDLTRRPLVTAKRALGLVLLGIPSRAWAASTREVALGFRPRSTRSWAWVLVGLAR